MKEETKLLAIRFPVSLLTKVKKLAEKTDRDVSYTVRKLIVKALGGSK